MLPLESSAQVGFECLIRLGNVEASFMEELWRFFGIKLLFVTAHHTQACACWWIIIFWIHFLRQEISVKNFPLLQVIGHRDWP